MKLSSTFPVPASPDKVLSLFLDPSTMQACIPGCDELTQDDETHYRGVLANEVAHVRFAARFAAEITSSSAPADTGEPAVVNATIKGEDRRLGSTVKVTAVLTIRPDGSAPDSSVVEYEIELAMWGKLGRLGESVIRRRTQEVERQFSEALAAVCAGRPIPQPADTRAARKAQRAAAPAAVSPTGATAPAAPAQAAQVAESAQGAQAAQVAPSAAVATSRPREDYLILGLAVAAAFAYGVLIGGRGRRR